MYRRINGSDVVVVSPHCDDAAYSLGGSLAARALGSSPLIVNVFTVSNYTVTQPGYADIETATQCRRREELAFAKCIGARARFLGFREPLVRGPYASLDSLFDMSVDPSADGVFADVMTSIDELCLDHKHSLWLFPLGIGGHIDHRILYDIGRHVLDSGLVNRCGFYPDLPYSGGCRSSMIEERIGCLESTLFPVKPATNVLQTKLTLLNTYASQLREEDIEAVTHYHLREPDELIWVQMMDSGGRKEA